MSFPSGLIPDFRAAVSLGLVPGYSRASGLGYNPNVGTTSTPEDCWGTDGLYPWLTALTNVEVVSSSANDSAAGSGARTINLLSLDDLYKPRVQTIILNGTTPVAVPLPIFRNNGGRVLTAGATGTNEGDITLRDAGGGTTRGIILTGIGTMRQAPYTVAAGFTLEIPQLVLGIDSSNSTAGSFVAMTTYFRAPGAAYFLPLYLGNTNSQPYAHQIDPPIALAEKNDFSLRIVKASANNLVITAGWNGILKAN